MKKAGIAGVFAGVAALVIFAISAMQSSRDGMAAPALTGQMQNFDLHETPRQVPPIAFRNEKGEAVHLSDFRGRVVLLNFWATWCPPCREEMPSMERLYRAYRDRGFTVVAVSVDTAAPPKIRSFLDELQPAITFPVLHDRDSLVARRYSVPGVPTSYLIDARGRIAYRALGEYDWFSPRAKEAVEALLEGAKHAD